MAGQNVTFDFLTRGVDSTAGGFRKVADNTVLAARGAKVPAMVCTAPSVTTRPATTQRTMYGLVLLLALPIFHGLRTSRVVPLLPGIPRR